MRQRVDKNSLSASTSADQKKESIVYRTRSKLSLEEIALEDIEQAFLPPDVTNDMYDPDYEIDDEWFRFCFDTYNTPVEKLNAEDEDEADPDFTLFGVEESETTKRSNNSLNSTLDSTLLESTKSDYYQSYLFENQNNILPLGSEYQSSTLNTPIRPVPFTPTASPAVIPKPIEIYIPQQDYCNDPASVHQIAPAIVINTVSVDPVVPTVPSNRLTIEEESDVGITPHQRDLIRIQMSQHVQLLAQQFLMTYKHPVLHKYSAVCKHNLEHLWDMADGDEDSAYNAINLSEALKLINDWEEKLQNPIFAKKYLNIVNENIILEKNMFEKRRLHLNTFAPKLCKAILDSKAMIHPVLLPRVFPKTKYYPKNEYLKSEESLIVMGLERFVTHVNKTSKSLFNTKVSRRNDAIKLISQHMMPIRNFNSLLCQIKKMAPTNELVRHFLCKGNNPPRTLPPMIHVFLPIKTLVEPKCQPIEELPPEWQEIMNDYNHLDDDEANIENTPVENSIQSLDKEPINNNADQPDEGYSTPENKRILLIDERRNMPSLFCTPEKMPEPEPSEDEGEGNLVVSEIKEEPVFDYYTEHDEETSFSFAEVLERRKEKKVLTNSLEIPKTSKKRKIEKSSSKSKKKTRRVAPTKTKKGKIKGKNFLIDSEFSDNEGGLPVINIENTEFSSDSNDSSVDIALKYKPWSKEEDQVLLENLKNKCFEAISSTLENRTVNEIKRRSDYLLGLIQKKHLS